MKKTLVTTLAIFGLAVYSYAQGTVGTAGSLTSNAGQYGSFYLDTENNTGTYPSSNHGLVYVGGTTSGFLLNEDVNIAIYDGSSLVVALLEGAGDTGPASGDGNVYGAGTFTDNSSAAYYDTLTAGGGTTSLTIDLWTGNFATYALADVNGSGSYVGTATFSQTLGDAPGVPTPSTPVTLTGMPAIELLQPVSAPEPTTIALATLGGISLLALRRRKAA